MTKKESEEVDNWTSLGLPIFATALTVALVGCVVSPEDEPGDDGGDSDPPEGTPQEEETDERGFVATSYTTSTQLGVNLEINVRPLELVDGEAIKLSMEVLNTSEGGYSLRDALSDTDNMHSASNATLIDSESQSRHLSNELEDGSCYCTFADGELAGGESTDLEVMFPTPPEGTESMTVTTPITSPFFDIPIVESSESPSEEYTDGEILPLTLISDDEGGTGRSDQETDEELSILLSSDVLFDLESSDLTSDADEIIEQVASEVDQSNSETVTIEGHTDNQGTDSVNDPLSEERAESVESALSELVTRDDVTFETEGHGSSDPVADNDTEEGQGLNRRVTVTFEK